MTLLIPGDVQEVLAVPRKERKQLFVTRLAMEYAENIKDAGFPQEQSSQRVRRPRPSAAPQRGGPATDMMMPGMMPDMMMEMFGGPAAPGGARACDGNQNNSSKRRRTEGGSFGFYSSD
jgi:hypothetical protein